MHNLPTPFERFVTVCAGDLTDGKMRIANQLGVYAFFIDGLHDALSKLGFEGAKQLLWHENRVHAYVGESANVGSRVLSHLRGNRGTSNLRHTLLSIQLASRALDPAFSVKDADASEAWLSEWLTSRTLVLYQHCELSLDVEDKLLLSTCSPLNISRPKPVAFGETLSSLKRQFDLLGWRAPGQLNVRRRR